MLVTGAGTSIEPPTAIPLAWQCSSDAHSRLIADGVLDVGDCNDPYDLSALADAVVQKTKSQEALVSRLAIEPMRNAKPNDGHLIAIALMIEGAISNIVTLNYDLAFSNAISELGIRNGIPHSNGF